MTGGGTGLGFAIAKELVGLGAQVVIAGTCMFTSYPQTLGSLWCACSLHLYID